MVKSMDKTMTIAVIALVAVIMGMSLVTPALARDDPSHKGVLVQAPFQCGNEIPGDSLCVAADADGDGNCEGHAFLMKRVIAERLGITHQQCGFFT